MSVFRYKSLQGEMARVLYRFRMAFYAVGLFSLAINLLMLAPSIYMLQVYDRVLTSRNEVTLLMVTLILIGLLLLDAMLEFVRSRVLIRASAALDLEFSSRLFNASFESYLRKGGSMPGQALGDFTSVRQFMTSNGVFAFFDAPWTPIYILVISLLSLWLGLFALVAVVVLLAMAYATERFTGETLREAGIAAASAGAYAANNIRHAETIEAMGMRHRVQGRWFERQKRFLILQATASDRAGLIGGATRFSRLMFQSTILGLGALLVIENQLSPGGMIAASILLGRALAPVDLGIQTWRGFVAARAAYGRLEKLLEEYPLQKDKLPLPRPTGNIQVENLFVGAPGSREAILKGISFSVTAGAMVAVIGQSGSGKSTLARTLVGVWGAMNGVVRLDGVDVCQWPKAELGPWVGYLPQDVVLFEGTIAENIARFGDVDSERIVAAARQAGVHDLIVRLPQGYDTNVGDGDVVLSGGQRQRIALARALYGNPVLYVLDEPNANLDDIGHLALIGVLEHLKQTNRTVFVVTHRQEILSVSDYVLVLAGGTKVAFDVPEKVRKTMLARMPRGASGAVVSPLRPTNDESSNETE